MPDPEKQLRVAFLGLGLMGTPMAGQVAAAGFPLTVWNRTPAAAHALAESSGGRARVAATPRESAAGADVVITMLADGDVLRSVYEGPDGVLAGLGAGAVAVDMGTSGPEAVTALAVDVRDAGAAFVDAPVSGSTAAARGATLTVMAGGDAAAVERARPVLATMGRAVHHVGPTGSGAVLKLAVNSIVFALTEAVAEALVLAERSGIDPSAAYDVFLDSAIAAPAVAYRRDAFLEPGRTPTSFRLALAGKDLRLTREQAGRVGAPVPQVDALAGIVDRAAADGLADADLAALASWLRRRA